MWVALHRTSLVPLKRTGRLVEEKSMRIPFSPSDVPVMKTLYNGTSK
jgi:hypothetical protein